MDSKPMLYTNSMPPTIQDVKVYFNQKGMPEREAETFFLFYEKRLWTSKRGNFFKSWKSIARRWIDALLVEMPWRFQRQGR